MNLRSVKISKGPKYELLVSFKFILDVYWSK